MMLVEWLADGRLQRPLSMKIGKYLPNLVNELDGRGKVV
jgi:hypothetical protein